MTTRRGNLPFDTTVSTEQIAELLRYDDAQEAFHRPGDVFAVNQFAPKTRQELDRLCLLLPFRTGDTRD